MDSRFLRILLVLGIVLDLLISGVLYVQQGQIKHNNMKNDCWSSVLDYAIQSMPKPDKHVLMQKAESCSDIK